MSMFCNQCEQAAHGKGCTDQAVCGKSPEVSDLFDLVLYQTKGLACLIEKARSNGKPNKELDLHLIQSLFLTVTNVNFDEERVINWIKQTDEVMDFALKLSGLPANDTSMHEATRFRAKNMNRQQLLDEAAKHSITALHPNEDIQSLIQLLILGLKGMAAYADHAITLNSSDPEIFSYMSRALARTLDPAISLEDLVSLNMECGKVNIRCMEILNEAHIENYGSPVPTKVSSSLKDGPAIVVSGHDLYMLEELLKQTDKSGVNVYTHGEMLPAHGYPELKKHPSLAGHFGTAWQNQRKEFDGQECAFIFNTNCIQKPKDSYSDRVFTTHLVGWPNVTHIEGHDFTKVIEKAKSLKGLKAKEGPTLMTGFGHDAVLSVADKVIAGVKTKAISHFFLVGGCDGAKSGRNYYTDLVEEAPKDTVILTLACGKFRFNYLQEQLGDIGGIPRLLDVGQCNDAYSAVKIAGALADAFDCDINSLPLSFVLSWYEQKAVVVLLSLLSLNVKNIRLGPSLPAFITPNILDFLVENFNIKPIGNSAKADLADMLA